MAQSAILTGAQQVAAIDEAHELFAEKTASEILSDNSEALKRSLIPSIKNASIPFQESRNDVTITHDLTASTLPKVWNKQSTAFSYFGGAFKVAGSSYPDSQFITTDGTVDAGTGTALSPKFVKSFLFYGDKFEFKYKNKQTFFEFIIDNKKAGDLSITGTGQIRYAQLVFSSVAFRRIDIVTTNAFVGDFYTENDVSVSPIPNPRSILIAGDSYTEGTGAGFGLGYVTEFMKLSGNYNVIQSGSGGTGYHKDNGGRPPLVDRVQTDIVDLNPDVVILAMGINDSSVSDLSLVEADIITTFNTIKTGLPNSTIIALGSWTSGEANAGMQAVTAMIKTQAESRGFLFINPTGTGNSDGWFTGTGQENSKNGDGNADIFISSDGTHPNLLGAEYLAVKLYQEILNLNVVI